MNKAEWTREAQADLAALDDEFSQLGPDYAYRVGRAALAAGRFLAEYPQAGPILDGSVRKRLVQRTDYVLLYRPIANGVEILRLQHAKRDWRPRRS
ncbi:type II toxin-antitoxin system RelE/ParE family toxin [Sphingomonas sp.]|jgi:plasmid stabilization system protein ParE|uniref:type II toxin-antitoxin system RelE/ParE family toxin n=1 Tax=Sphingomonas sp. TaxID=28214 RepID=UPI003F70CA8E